MAANEFDKTFYPEDDELKSFINRRNQRGWAWQMAFMTALIIAIIVLITLVYNIFNSAFGLVALENEVDPEDLVVDIKKNLILTKPNAVNSEDDNELVAGVGDFDSAIGFFGYAFYQNNADSLKLLSVDGVLPSAETAADGSYPISRPLFIYTSAEVIEANPAVGAFVDYYLDNVNSVIEEVGYFPISNVDLSEDRDLLESAGISLDPNATGSVEIAGSSTVFPLTQRLAQDFGGDVSVDSVGSSAGIRAFCNDGSIDIANASRAMTTIEMETCMANGRTPIEIMVGTDAIAVVANPNNSFLTDLSQDELALALTESNFWDEVNSGFGADPVITFVPGADSGTLDFLIESVYSGVTLDGLDKEALVAILPDYISRGRGRTLEREQRFFEDRLVFDPPEAFAEACESEEPPTACSAPARDKDNIVELVTAEVVVPQVQQTWPLVDSIFSRQEILAEAGSKYPNAEVVFKSWLTWDFLTSAQSSEAELAGVRIAIIGTLLVVMVTFLFSFPVGVGAAIYLEEYASKDAWYNRIIQTNISNLAGVPSIIYGMLGLAVFVRLFLPVTSGQLFGFVDEGVDPSGRTVLSAGLTLGLLILPIIIINSQEALRAVPGSIRRAGLGLGATKWQTTWSHVLPQALPGILTGTILAMSRAIGETAPLLIVGASTVIRSDPELFNGALFSRFTALPIQIYQWTSRPQAEFQNIAAAAIIVLLVLLLTLNSTAVYLRNRYATR